MKVCDIADWFDEDFNRIVVDELRDVPRFHRKQWEFAWKFRALRDMGVLRPDAVGVSFGAGQERLLYALAPHVGRLWATDLYDPDTIWPQARTGDIDAFIRENAPFPVPAERLSAKIMDMRTIEFPDETFDFAYSSSAVEHIGDWDDFRSHLDEVRRVLKPGGVYVMTTDIIYGPAWNRRGNYKFTPEGLQWWLQESGMAYEPLVDCRIAHHRGNQPMPANITPYMSPHSALDRPNLIREVMAVQMLMGRYPHGSVILAMRKAPQDRVDVAFPGYEETKAFLLENRHTWESYLAEARLGPDAAAHVPVHLRAEMWAIPYMLLGAVPRAVTVRIQTDRPGNISIGINKIHSDALTETVVHEPERTERTTGDIEFRFMIDPEPEWTYAVHGRALNGISLGNVSVLIEGPGHGPIEPAVVRRVPEPVASNEPVRKGTGLIRLANRLLRPTGLRLDR
jgi:SAM-dependent methyltransferase